MLLLEIITADPYNVAFALAAITALVLAHRAGRRDARPPLAWAVLLAAALSGAIAGSKLLFLDFEPIAPGEKTVLGGIILGVAAVIVMARTLRLGVWRSLDALTVPTLAGMAIGRVGCFFADCCAGTETSLPWAVRDADGHGVHPVQLYEGAANLLLIGVLSRTTRNRPAGARILVATLSYSGIRFLTEFVREGRTLHFGLNLVQWSLVAIGVALAVVAWVRASHSVGAAASAQVTARTAARAALLTPDRAPVTAMVLVALLVSVALSMGSWLVPLEQAALFLLAGGVTASGLLAAIDVWAPEMRVRLVPLTLAPRLGVMLMMQDPEPAEEPRRQLIVGTALMRGAYEQVVGRGPLGTDCDGGPVTGDPTIAERESIVTTATVGMRQRLKSGNHITLEAQLLSGRDRLVALESGPTDFTPRSVSILGGGGAYTIEGPGASFRVGMLGGAVSARGRHASGPALTSTARLGDDRRWFLEANYANAAWFGTLGDFTYLGIGFTGGRTRARGVLGVGEGALFGLHVPVRGVEVDLAFRTVDRDQDGAGASNSFSIGMRRAFPIR